MTGIGAGIEHSFQHSAGQPSKRGRSWASRQKVQVVWVVPIIAGVWTEEAIRWLREINDL